MDKNSEMEKVETAKVVSLEKITTFVREHKTLDIAIVFGAAVFVLILVGVLALKQPVVPVCIALMLEAGIAIALHNAELWIHGVAIVIELIGGALIARVALMILCIALYVLTIAALQMLDKYAEWDNGKA